MKLQNSASGMLKTPNVLAQGRGAALSRGVPWSGGLGKIVLHMSSYV